MNAVKARISLRDHDSKMTFTPADFCIGESGIWFFSIMWENGRNYAPNEYLDDRSIVGTAE